RFGSAAAPPDTVGGGTTGPDSTETDDHTDVDSTKTDDLANLDSTEGGDRGDLPDSLEADSASGDPVAGLPPPLPPTPIVWYEDSQLTGDSIAIQLVERKV